MRFIAGNVLLLTLCLAVSSATHSAYSPAIPWDQTTAIETPSAAAPKIPGPALAVVPNPAEGGKSLRFFPSGSVTGTIHICDITGKRVATLFLPVGGPAVWNGLGSNGRPLPVGVYVARLLGRASGEIKFIVLN